jgi:hypothetical protein
MGGLCGVSKKQDISESDNRRHVSMRQNNEGQNVHYFLMYLENCYYSNSKEE